MHLGVCLLEPAMHERRVPTKVIVPLGGNDLPRRAAVEDYGLNVGPGDEGKGTEHRRTWAIEGPKAPRPGQAPLL